MLAAAGGTYQAADIGSDRPTAHIVGTPYDKTRLDVFDEAVRELETLAPTILQATGVDEEERRWLPLFEAYFSNYIEGTKFSVEEAKDIVLRGIEPADRPADAHDVSATYQIVTSLELMSQTPRDADDSS